MLDRYQFNQQEDDLNSNNKFNPELFLQMSQAKA
jgi:hypothetical protein